MSISSRSDSFSSELSSDDEASHLINPPSPASGLRFEGEQELQDDGAECKLLVSTAQPISLDSLPISHSAYIRYANQLYYANKVTGELTLLPKVGKRTLLQLDLELGLRSSMSKKLQRETDEYSSRFLSTRELNKILLLTGHEHPQNPRLPEKSAWQKKNGCDLLIVSEDPATLNLADLPITNAAYLRHENQLWYVRKNRNWLEKIFYKERTLLDKVQGEELERFDQVMNTTASRHRSLTDKDLSKAIAVAKHAHKTLWQDFLAKFGYFCSGFIAVGSGVSTAGAFIALNLVTGGLASVGAALLFLAGTAVNWLIFKRYVSPVLIDLFGREKFLIDENGKPLSIWKKLAMGIALTLSLSVGATFGALTYGSTFTLTTAFTFLAAAAPIFPYVAAVLAGVTLICMTALMIKDISDLIKKTDVIGECKNFLKNLVSLDPELPQNKGKSPGRILAERIATVAMTAVFLPLACLGLYMTMNACAPGVKAILLDKIPSLSATVADNVAKVVSLGLAFVGQIPFGIQTAFQTIAKIFSPKAKEFVPASQAAETTLAKTWKGIKLLSVAINAIGNGLISMMGAVGSLFRALALVSGTGNSAFAGVPAVLNTATVKVKLNTRSIDDLFLAEKNKSDGTVKRSLVAPLAMKAAMPPSTPLSQQREHIPPVRANLSSLFAAPPPPRIQAAEAKEAQRAKRAAADDFSITYSRKIRV